MWPDVGVKSSAKFSIKCQKVVIAVIIIKLGFLNYQKVPKYLGNVCKKFFDQELSKIAQSGHTVASKAAEKADKCLLQNLGCR